MIQTLRDFIISLSMSGYLPDFFQYNFVINSIICSLLIGPILGAIGTMVVTKKMAFFSEAIGHSALTGIALGILLGEPAESPYIMLFSYCIIFAIIINYTRNKTKMSSDTLIGIFLSFSIALGGSLLVLVSSKANIHLLEGVLFGSILSVSDKDILVLFLTTVILLAVIIPSYNKTLLASFNPNIATVRGVNVKFIEYVFIILITIITVSSIKIIGAALVEALFLIPAASAKNIASSMKSFFVYSVVFSTASCIIGIVLPLLLDINIPSGGSIILVASFIFFVTVLIRNFSRRLS